MRIGLCALGGLVAVLAFAGAGCSGGSSTTATETVASTVATETTPTTTNRQVSHVAPDLEALLPGKVGKTRLVKGSTTGAAVFGGGDEFSRTMTQALAAVGKKPSDLRFANAQDPKGKLELEVGVFAVEGMAAAVLRRAIVAASRPNAPGLTVSRATLGGKPVTAVAYPAGTALYLYERAGRVFYVGTQNEALARQVLAELP